MREIIIKENEAGQRFDKFLKKYLSEASGSFIYKMLRKKNIVLNGKKATGNEKLNKGDSVKLFFADETLDKFTASKKNEDFGKYLPKVKLLSKSRLFELIYLLLVNLFMVCICFIKLPLFEKVLLDKHSFMFSIYVLTLTFIIVYDLIYLITFIRRKVRYGYYIKARDGVLEKIYVEKDNCEMKLRQYVYAELATYGDMDMKVSKFARISKYYQYIGYIRKRIGMKRRMQVDKVNVAEKTGFIITLLTIVTLVILMIL